MIFKKKYHEIRWSDLPNDTLVGKVTILTQTISLHKNSFFGMRNYSEASGIHVPNAYQVIGKVVSKENIELTSETVSLLIPEIEIDEIGAKQSNRHLVLWMSSPSKCFKIEMENRA